MHPYPIPKYFFAVQVMPLKSAAKSVLSVFTSIAADNTIQYNILSNTANSNTTIAIGFKDLFKIQF